MLFQLNKDDLTSTTGSNMSIIKKDALRYKLITKYDDILDLNPKLYKRTVRYDDFPEDDRYKINMLNELVIIRDREILFDSIDFEDDYIADMIAHLCNN